MADVASQLQDFAEIVQANVPLAPFSMLKVGGPAEALVQPRTLPELCGVVKRCHDKRIPLRVLGGGGNLLILDEGVKGVVLRLGAPAFSQITIQGQQILAGAGALMSALISRTARHGLAGLETFVGAPGTVGGALHNSPCEGGADIGPFVQRVEAVDATGAVAHRDKEELRFEYRGSSLDDPVIVSAELVLEPDTGDAIIKRMRKAWIQRKAHQPFSFQAYARMFKNPPGLSAAALIEQTGLVGVRVGGAVVSDRDANAVLAESGASARDVSRLIDLVRARVEERFHVSLDLAISIWR